MSQEETNNYCLLTVGNQRMLLPKQEDARILQPYEYRETPGRIVKGLHMGNPLIDLGQLLSGNDSSMHNGIITSSGWGILVDEAKDVEIRIKKSIDLDKSITCMKGNIIGSYAQTTVGTLPVLSVQYLFSSGLVEDIETELRDREWI